jgi:hypothetical protein
MSTKLVVLAIPGTARKGRPPGEGTQRHQSGLKPDG